jgi:dipeptidyl aminopeptidase/acylaminoacyl peptidase
MTLRTILRFLACTVSGFTLVHAQAGTRSAPIDSLLSLQSVGSPQLSPDGTRVAYLLTSTDWKQDAFVSQLWMHTVSTGTAQQLTRHEAGVSQVQWSPDGRFVSFVSGRVDGRNQVFALSVEGGEPIRLTDAPGGVSTYAWSRDARAVAFTSTPVSAARKAREALYAPFDVVRRDYAKQVLYTVDVALALGSPQPGVRRSPEAAAYTIGAFEWSPDGTRIAFSAATTPDPVSANSADIYVLALVDSSVRALVTQAGPDTDPHWSPDGRQIVFSSAMGNTRTVYFANSQLALVDAAGSAVRSVTKTFDENPSFVAWGADGIFFSAQQRTTSHLFRLDPATAAITRVSAPDSGRFNGFSLRADRLQAAFVHSTPTTLPEIAISAVASFQPRVLTAMSEQLRPWRIATRELFRWKSKDGTEIEGVLVKPRDFDPTRKYPLLCVLHGGPTGIDRPVFSDARYYPVDEWVNRGALVLKVNYRGSAGYGERFRALNYRNLGVGDAWDVESGVDALIAQGSVDPAKVAAMGWSQGGYISAFLTAGSTKFAATSVGAGISDWRTYYYNTDITPFTINYLGADPVADPAIYARTSPVDRIRNARTPTLIQHGENDRRVPIANAYQLRQALEDRNVPVEMIVYKGFGHGITKPKSQRAVMQHNLLWFNHYLFGDPRPDFVRSDSAGPSK